MSAALTLDRAAERAGVSRWTVARALKVGRLRGFRDNRGRWRIDPEALDAWAAEQGTVLRTVPHMVQAIAPAEQDGAAVQPPGSELATEVAVLRVRLEGVEARAAELEHDRDRWRDMAERLSERVAEPRPGEVTPAASAVPAAIPARARPGLLGWLLGRSRASAA